MAQGQELIRKGHQKTFQTDSNVLYLGKGLGYTDVYIF